MPADYVEQVRRLDWHGLRVLWRQIEAGTAGWPAGKALEHLVLRAFELSGAEVRWPFDVRIDNEPVEQIDGAVHLGTLACLVECKDTAARVDVKVLAKLRSQLLRRHAGVIGLLVSRTGFTPAAMALAGFMAPQMILLWTGDDVALHLEQEDFGAALREKYRHVIETGDPTSDPREQGGMNR